MEGAGGHAPSGELVLEVSIHNQTAVPTLGPELNPVNNTMQYATSPTMNCYLRLVHHTVQLPRAIDHLGRAHSIGKRCTDRAIANYNQITRKTVTSSHSLLCVSLCLEGCKQSSYYWLPHDKGHLVLPPLEHVAGIVPLCDCVCVCVCVCVYVHACACGLLVSAISPHCSLSDTRPSVLARERTLVTCSVVSWFML